MSSKRPSRGISLTRIDPQVQLRNALRNNDFETFEKLVRYRKVDLEFIYQYPDYKTCLEIAVSEPNKQDFIKLLLGHNVQVNVINQAHAAAPIHFAVEYGNKEALRLLLKDDRIDVNVKYKGNTALLMAIKKIEDLKDDHDRIATYEHMIELLLKAGCNANSPDLKGVTPVCLAAKQRLEKVVTLISEYANNRVDVDTYEDIHKNTARYYLEQAFPHLLGKFDAAGKQVEVVVIDKLFYYLSKHEENNFVEDFTKLTRKNDHGPVLAAHNGMNNMLQLATDKGFEKVVATLLNSGADPNATCSGNINRPIGYACKNGFSNILKMFINNESTLFDPIDGESLIQITVKGMRSYDENSKADFKGCLEMLIKNPKIDINHSDMKDNTALHYAARNGDHETVLELLRNGACVGLRNKFDEPPLADINAKTLETYLDECITTNDERLGDDSYQIHLKYSFLAHPNKSFENEVCIASLVENSNNKLAPETDALLYMTRNEELRQLLKHPVITSFLYLKWQRISCLFHANITLYSLFCMCLVLYIILDYGVQKQQSDSIETLYIATRVGAMVGLILLTIRELIQSIMSPTRYLQRIEYWMEIALILVTAWILCYDSAREATKQQLSAVAILLSSTEMVFLIGQFSSTYIAMFRTVCWNFFKFMLWYCFLIIAFSLTFYILFRKIENNDSDDTGNEKEAEDHFFEDPGSSFFKTIVMSTGEFETGSIKFSIFPVTSHIIFILFVFVIPIVLFNLLNALAVHDTHEIIAKAELVGHISQIKLISYFESLLIGVSAFGKPFRCRSWLLSNCKQSHNESQNCTWPNMLRIKPLAERINLLPHFLPNYKIIVKPNQENKIEIPNDEPLPEFGDIMINEIESGSLKKGVKGCFERRRNHRLDSKIVEKAKAVISKKNDIGEFDVIKNKLTEFETKIISLENTVKEALQALHR